MSSGRPGGGRDTELELCPGYDSVEGALKSTFSSTERGKKDFWETARWVMAGTAVIGIVFVILPGKKS